jgi:hypothetical protein
MTRANARWRKNTVFCQTSLVMVNVLFNMILVSSTSSFIYSNCHLSKKNGENIILILPAAENRIPLAPMGALAPGSAPARPSAQGPMNTCRNLLTQVSGGREICLKTVPINFLAISGTFCFSQKKP